MTDSLEHGRVEHELNETESVIWDTTEIRPDVKQAFREAFERRLVANRKILARLRPRKTGSHADQASDDAADIFGI